MIFESFRNIFKIPELRTKIFYTMFFLFVFRIGSQIPIPGIQIDQLKALIDSGDIPGGGGAAGYFVYFSSIMGGSLRNCAIFSLGIMPYISASIIFSLLAKVVPALEALSKEGPSGQKKINEYTRYATIPLCLIQSFMIISVFKQPLPGGGSLVPDPSPGFHFFDFTGIVALTAGAIFLMWLGEQISEYGLGNGISILIMAGIVSQMPHQVELMIRNSEKGSGIKHLIILTIIFAFIVAAVIYMTFGQRKIAIQQARQVRGKRVYGGQKHFMPLKVNQSGVMPVIFASSLLIFPQLILRWIFGEAGAGWFGAGTFLYVATYIVMIFFFGYFWTSLMFNPPEMANQLKEYGSFIPGIRPGKKTADYLDKVMTRITFVGSGFLAAIALLPLFLVMAIGIDSQAGQGFAFNLGGTSILIVVGVVLDVVQKLESHLMMRHYEGFTTKGSGRGRR